MSGRPMPGNRTVQARGRAPLVLLVGILLVMTVIAAGVIVVRNARRIPSVEAPVHLRPNAPDPGLRRFRRNLRHRMQRVEQRYLRHSRELEVPTPEQESLARVIVFEFAEVRDGLAALDTLAGEGNQRELNRRRVPLFARYKELVTTVSRYVRTMVTTEGPELDSLDRELERLLRDE